MSFKVKRGCTVPSTLAWLRDSCDSGKAMAKTTEENLNCSALPTYQFFGVAYSAGNSTGLISELPSLSLSLRKDTLQGSSGI